MLELTNLITFGVSIGYHNIYLLQSIFSFGVPLRLYIWVE
jgi:hypothetical protein